ncbi:MULTISPECIES: hypothetical protein [unclassified Streptomyces]|uniref:hypothetical protein n=1 Tax=unclassified Streptomyces TaxID=2593676 RepID=UPI002E2CD356|nr:hypothetical protein [Streptomyces sp. NBC_01439]
MGRAGDITPPELPPGARRDFNRALHHLYRRAGRPSMRTIAAARGFSHGAVQNAFGLPKVPSYEVMEAVTGYLTEQVRDWGRDANHKDPIGKELLRLEKLWHQAQYEADRVAAQGAPPDMSEYTRDLLYGLSPACSIPTCGKTRELDRPYDIVALEDPDEEKFSQFPAMRPTGLSPQAPNPWLLLRLCRSCRRRRDAGEFTGQELREARYRLDRLPGAARHYAAYLDHILLGAEPALDMNVAGSALAIIMNDPEMAASPYVLGHGLIKVDRANGSLDWGRHPCEDEHPQAEQPPGDAPPAPPRRERRG